MRTLQNAVISRCVCAVWEKSGHVTYLSPFHAKQCVVYSALLIFSISAPRPFISVACHRDCDGLAWTVVVVHHIISYCGSSRNDTRGNDVPQE